MYSGTTLTAASGRVLGAHQKIDRVARRHVAQLLKQAPKQGIVFPNRKTILHFEGRNGPDGVKRKSPAQDEPWHYFNPFDATDRQLVSLIEQHYENLVKALRGADEIVAAFEAAWLAHAIVDGLTPAHHYPYEEKLDEIRGGLGKESRTTLKDKIVMPGDSRVEVLRNNWKMWGPKGLLTTHGAFEWGVATILLPMSLKTAFPKADELEDIKKLRADEYFIRTAKEIAALGLYDRFYTRGWTSKLARDVRHLLVPSIVKTVTLIWYKATVEAAESKGK